MRSMVEEARRYAEPVSVKATMRAPERTFRAARRLRREMTLPEVLLWRHLRRGQLDGLLFRRQHPFGTYVLDFYCPAARLAVEVDGMAHDAPEQILRDERWTLWLAGQGVETVRFLATDVLRDESLEGVLLAIAEAAKGRVGSF